MVEYDLYINGTIEYYNDKAPATTDGYYLYMDEAGNKRHCGDGYYLLYYICIFVYL